MRRRWILFFIIVVCLFLLACSEETKVEDPESTEEVQVNTDEEMDEKPVIHMGAMDFPPYEYAGDGQMKGPLIDIVTEAFYEMGYTVEIKEYAWSRLLQNLKTGEVDVAIDIFDTPERRSFLYYPETPIGFYEQALIKLKSNPFQFKGELQSLKGFSVGVVRDYSYGNDFDSYAKSGNVTLEKAHYSDGNFEKLLQKRVDLIIENLSYAVDFIQQRNIEEQVEIMEPVVSSTYSYAAFSKANDLAEVRTAFDEQVKRMHESGRIYEIFEAHQLGIVAERFEKHMASNPPREKFLEEKIEGPLKIGALNYTYPYIAKVDGEFEGLFVDIMKEAFDRIGVDYEIKDYAFTRMLEALKVGVLDVGVDIFVRPEREAYLMFPEAYPIASFPYNMFKLKSFEFEFSGDPMELTPYRVGVIRGYSLGDYDAYLEDDRFQFIYSNDSEQNIEKLINGRADLVIDIASTGLGVIESKDLTEEIEVVNPPINVNYTYLGFSKVNGLEKLVKEYEQAIESMIADGTINRIFNAYEIAIPDQLKQ